MTDDDWPLVRIHLRPGVPFAPVCKGDDCPICHPELADIQTT